MSHRFHRRSTCTYGHSRFYGLSEASFAEGTAATFISNSYTANRYMNFDPFEIIVLDPAYPATNPDPNQRFGRLTKIEDRNGNAITLSYEFAANATMTDLSSDQDQLTKISTISDPYGQMLTITYTHYLTTLWCISRIDLPTSQHLSYNYDAIGPAIADGSQYYGLASVDHPDGTITTISCDYDTTSQCMVLSLFDPAAEPTHRKKRSYLAGGA